MTIATVNDPILAKSRGSIQQVQDYIAPHNPQRVDFVNAYLTALWTLCNAAGVDFLLAAAQAVEETEFFTSSWWLNRGNPAGLGITGDAAQDAASPTFPNGAVAAKAQVAHLTLYATGDVALGGLTPADDPRHDAYVAAYGAQAIARTIGALSGKWAADTQYGVQIAAHANGILAMPIKTPAPTPPAGGPSMALDMTKGLIPLPAFEDRLIPDANNTAWDDLGQRTVKGFVLHRMLGTLDGTDGYFRTMGNAQQTRQGGLTDFGQDAVSGKVYLWNSPLGFGRAGVSPNRAGWASGVFNVHGDAYGDGLAFVNKYGLDGVNRDEVSWEISGQYGDPWSDAAQAVAAQACAAYAHDYGITYEQFPIAPQDGFSFVRWHQEITGPAEKVCPGPVVIAATDAWIEKVRAIMKAAQTASAPAPAPIPVPAPKPTPKPAPVPGIPLPAGVSVQLLERLYTGSPDNKLMIGGQAVSFDPSDEVSRAWLTRCIASIPHGKPWREGSWPPIKDRIRRGVNGKDGTDFLLGDGHIIHADAHGHVAA